jgi:putative ABC transport system permease protein
MFISFNLLAIRTSLDDALVAGHVRDIVRAADPAVRVRNVARYTDFLRAPLAWPRFNTMLLTIFAASALLLSAIGLYGVMAASVRQRQGEIGVRLAIGATARDVRRLVLGEGLRLTLAGLILGLMLVIAVTRALRGLLFEIQPLDPVSLGTASLVLAAAAIAVCWLPARRASRVDPIEALRTQ